MNILLLIAIILFGVADILLTNRILSNGGRELNPIMRLCMDRFGNLWFIPKLMIAIIAGVCFILFIKSIIPIAILVIVQFCIVVWNIFVLVSMKKG